MHKIVEKNSVISGWLLGVLGEDFEGKFSSIDLNSQLIKL